MRFTDLRSLYISKADYSNDYDFNHYLNDYNLNSGWISAYFTF